MIFSLSITESRLSISVLSAVTKTPGLSDKAALVEARLPLTSEVLDRGKKEAGGW
jgi:hypothetical protein